MASSVDPQKAEASRRASRAWKARNLQHVRSYNRKRSRDKRLRGRCTECKGLMGKGVFADGTCRRCRAVVTQRRWDIIERMWKDARPAREIAESLGWSTNHLGVEIYRMRKAGRQVPHRRKKAVA